MSDLINKDKDKDKDKEREETLSAFEKYLLALPPREATDHVLSCLRDGPSDSEAWSLMSSFNGIDWKCAPKDLPRLIGRTIHSLSLKALTLRLNKEIKEKL